MSAEELFAKASPAVVRVVVRDSNFKVTGQGSGFFISSDGLLVTNYHVVKSARFATVLLSDGSVLFVDGVSCPDKEADLALLRVHAQRLPHLAVADSIPPRIGTTVYAIGNPYGLTNTFSKGIVSAHRKVKGKIIAIQTTAAISPGSSGGPLLAPDGRVVGVTTAYLRGGQNLNFAVPASSLLELMQDDSDTLRQLTSAGGTPLDKEATDQLNKAWLAMGKKDWRTAMETLMDLRAKQKKNPLVWYALGNLHFELGNYVIAVEQYKAAIAIKPDYLAACMDMGAAYLSLERPADALVAFKAAFAIDGKCAEAQCGIGDTYRCLQRYALALGAYKAAIVLDGDCADAYVGLAATYSSLKNYTEAITALKTATVIEPDCAHAYERMAQAYLHLNRPREAVVAFKAAIALDPKNFLAHRSLGTAYDSLKRYTEAVAAFRAAIALNPKDASTHWWLATAYQSLNRHTEAIATFKAAIALDPKDALTHRSLGTAYVRLNRHTEAVAAFRAAIALDPKDASTHWWLGFAYQGIKRDAEAIAAYEMAIRLKPDYAAAYHNMGVAYGNAMVYDKALKAYDQAVRLDPNGKIGRTAAYHAAQLREYLRTRR